MQYTRRVYCSSPSTFSRELTPPLPEYQYNKKLFFTQWLMKGLATSKVPTKTIEEIQRHQPAVLSQHKKKHCAQQGAYQEDIIPGVAQIFPWEKLNLHHNIKLILLLL
jgi:hypothetical protein